MSSLLEHRSPRLLGPVAVLATTALAIGAGMIALREPKMALVLFPALVAAPAMIRWPELVTLLACFVLYTNAAVVAVKFHGVPYAIGAAVPAALLLPLAVRIRRGDGLFVAPGLAPLLALLAMHLAGVTWSEYPGESLEAALTFALEGVLVFVLITNAVRTKAILRKVTWALVAAGFVLGAAPLYQQLSGDVHNDLGGFGQLSTLPFYEPGRKGQGLGQYRLAGAIGEQNRFAQVLLVLIPLGAYLVATARTRPRRIAALVCLAVIGAGASLAFSRGAAVGFAILVVAAVVIGAIRTRGLVALGAAVALSLLVFPQYRQRLVTIPSATSILSSEQTAGEPVDGAIRGRATSMLAAALVYGDHPLLGIGPGVFRNYSQKYGNPVGLRKLDEGRRAHCLYLELAAELGTIGLLCFGATLFVILRALLRTRRRAAQDDPDSAGLATAYFLAVVGYLATALFLHLSYIRYFWLLVGLAASAARLDEDDVVESDGDEPEELAREAAHA